MDDDGGSPNFKRRGMKDRTNYLVTGIGIGMVFAFVADSFLLGLSLGVLLSAGMEAAALRGWRLPIKRRFEKSSFGNNSYTS